MSKMTRQPWYAQSSRLGLAQAVSGPELIRDVEILWINPDLGCLPVADVPDLDSTILQPLAGPFAAGRVQRDSVLVAGNDVVQLKMERAARELESPAKHRQHLGHAIMVPG